jgi:hypothetical protein
MRNVVSRSRGRLLASHPREGSSTMEREMSRVGPARDTGPAATAALVVVALGLLALLTGAGAAAAVRPARAHASSVLSVHDEGHLHYVHASGSVIIDEGSVSGSFPGSVRVRFLYDGEPEVSASFTITGHGGSISAHGSGTLSSPTSPSPSFKGHLTVTGGSGRYAHVHGGGELFGVYNRRSYALTVQAIGKLPY